MNTIEANSTATIAPGDLVTCKNSSSCYLWRAYDQAENGQLKMVHPHQGELESHRSALVISIIEGSKQIPIVALLVSTANGSDVFRFTWRHMLRQCNAPTRDSKSVT